MEQHVELVLGLLLTERVVGHAAGHLFDADQRLALLAGPDERRIRRVARDQRGQRFRVRGRNGHHLFRQRQLAEDPPASVSRSILVN